MFTMVEMIVIMQVLVLMCLIKLMVGQSTCSATTEMKGLGTAIGRLRRGDYPRIASVPPRACLFRLFFPDCIYLADRRCCLSLLSLVPFHHGSSSHGCWTACSNGGTSASPVFPEHCWKMLKGNIILYAALVRVVPFPLAQTSTEKVAQSAFSFPLTLMHQEEMWHWASYRDVGCL